MVEYRILKLLCNGDVQEMWSNHKDLSSHFDGNDFTFCGAIDECLAVAICESNLSDKPMNVFSEKFDNFFDASRGDIILIGSDENGMACNLDIRKILSLLLADT